MQPGTLWPQLPLVSTQREIEDLHNVWEAARMMLLALTNVEAKAVMRTDRARRYGDRLRCNAHKPIKRIIFSGPSGTYAGRVLFDMGGIEAMIDEFVNGC